MIGEMKAFGLGLCRQMSMVTDTAEQHPLAASSKHYRTALLCMTGQGTIAQVPLVARQAVAFKRLLLPRTGGV